MPKNIIVCSDGTGNTNVKDRGTNVFKLYEAVDLNGHKIDSSLKVQVAIYDDGVGSQNLKLLKVLGGAFGWGLSRNIRQLYTELSRIYENGDDIYLFGFSRGAYTVRMLAGFICSYGLLKSQINELIFKRLVWKAYSRYYRRYLSFLMPNYIETFKEKNADNFIPVSIKFIGVWDTVDAVGLPFDEVTNILNFFLRFRFKDNKLYKDPDNPDGPKVERACHALAMDDERRTFHPVLWNEKEETDDRIEQVWFPGMHSNVGGGYPKQGMSLVSLDWMMTKAEEKDGIRFMKRERELYRQRQNINDKLYNSRSGLAVYYRYKPRDIEELCKESGTTPKIHVSALERITQGTEGYAPGNFPKVFQPVFTDKHWFDPSPLMNKFQAALGIHGSLLKKHEGLIRTRVVAYYCFLFFSLWAIVGYAWGPDWIDKFSELSSMKGLKSLWNDYLQSRSWLVIAWFISVGIGLLTRISMKKKFTEFWYSI